MRVTFFVIIAVLIGCLPAKADNPQQTYSVGVARIDITPDYPIRLSGFGFRRTESEGVTQRIWAKALAIDDGEPAVFLAIDTCGISAAHVRELAARLEKKARLKPDRLAVTVTHTHTAPMLHGVLATLFGQPIPKEHQDRINRYTSQFLDDLEKVSLTALADRKPARLSWGIGKVGFAANRRTKDGPVDHDLPVLVARNVEGKPRAILVSYACHCVTLSHNKIGGDWAGHAQEHIENEFPGATALVCIGCGADSNPHPRGKGDDVELASQQGKQIAAEVKRLANMPLQAVSGKLVTTMRGFDLPLAPLPTRADWEERAKRTDAIGYHAKVQLERLDRGAALPTKIGYSVQTWAFGQSLAMVFLPGEVVVDYSLRLKRELDGLRVWVNGYSNDVPCYIPSERVLKEGGYEGGGAMTYYDLPAPLQHGLEQKIIDAVREQLGRPYASPFDARRTSGSRPLSPPQSLATILTRKDLEVELVAAEPMVTDPVAIDWGPDGRLWIAEMHDYPAGIDGKFKPGGRIRVLTDTDGDGRYDTSTVFLDGIPFPTGVTAWRQGVLVCAAPDILYAEDRDSDGRADLVRKLFSGFGTHNYQARVNSLEYGLDGWVHGSCGLFGGTISSFAGGEPVQLGDRDFRIKPDTGELTPATGRTQQGRVRDDWGNWFGCDNSSLGWHYPLADHYLKRNPYVPAPNAAVAIAQDPNPNLLFPARADLQLFKLTGPHGHTTAACGMGIYRDDLLGSQYSGNSFTCEPVNLVVHRRILAPTGSTFAGRRADDETASEFLSSTDNWFRPVQVRTGPDGCLWVVDMYRFVIEHPRWIPLRDLIQLDFRAGSTMGRIYRIRPKGTVPRPMPRLDKLDAKGLVAALDSPNGWQRDMASQMLLWKNDQSVASDLLEIAKSSPRPEARLYALCVLDGLHKLDAPTTERALTDPHPGVRRHGVRLAEKFLPTSPSLGMVIAGMIDDPDPQVRLQLAYSLGEWHDARSGRALAMLAQRHISDHYLIAAVLSSMTRDNLCEFAGAVLADDKVAEVLSERVVSSAVGIGGSKAIETVMAKVTSPREGRFASWQFIAVARAYDLIRSDSKTQSGVKPAGLANVTAAARAIVANANAAEPDRLAALRLLGRDAETRSDDIAMLSRLLAPRNSPLLQSAALAALARIDDERVAPALTATWGTYSPTLKNQVLDLCLGREMWQQHLLNSIEKDLIPAAHLDAVRRQRLLSHKDAGVRGRAEKVFGGATNPDRQRILDEFRNVLSISGDAARGKLAFEKSCAKCHRLHDAGHTVGPDLASLTNKTPEYLLMEILDPNRNLDSRYIEYFAITKSGQTVTGVLSSETSTSITLRAAEGKEHVFLRQELDEFQSRGKSLMPEGIEKELSPQELADVIAYLTNPVQAADAPALAKKILEDGQPAAERQAIIRRHPELAAELLAAMVADLKPGVPEEYRRIPWIWQVTVAAGRRNQTEQLRRIVEIALPKLGEPLRDWQAVVIGGGVINGISLQNVWPKQRMGEILAGNKDLTARWDKSLSLAAAMVDNEKTPIPTRYDALRIIGLDAWERSGAQLTKYLGKGVNDELQMGAISGLADLDAPPVAETLLSGLGHYSDANRKLALNALLRTDARTASLLDALEQNKVKPAQLDPTHRKALREHANDALRSRAMRLLD